MAICYSGLVKLYESAHRENANDFKKANTLATARLRESIQAKDIDVHNFDFGRCFAEFFGWNDFQTARSTGKLATEIMESAGPITTAAFQQISGQIIYGLILDPYNSPEFKFTKLIPVRQTLYDFEKVAGVSPIGDEVLVVKERDVYPVVGVTEKYRNAPLLQKRGFRVQLTREVIFFDRTGQLQSMAAGGGLSMGQNREKRAVDCIIDENAGAASAISGGHRYHYLGNSIASYGDSSGNHDWDNLSATTTLLDWTSVQAANLLLQNMLDPSTGEPIIMEAKHLVVAQQNELTALRVRNATEINVTTPGYATSGNPTQTTVGNPYQGKFEVMTSPYVAFRQATKTTWYWGDVQKACEYCQAWPEEVKQLAGGTQLEFDQDIVQQYRFSEMGAFSVKEPRALVKATVA